MIAVWTAHSHIFGCLCSRISQRFSRVRFQRHARGTRQAVLAGYFVPTRARSYEAYSEASRRPRVDANSLRSTVTPVENAGSALLVSQCNVGVAGKTLIFHFQHWCGMGRAGA